MKKRLILVLIMAFMLVTGTTAVSFAAEGDPAGSDGSGTGYETKYTVRIYPGLQGTISKDAQKAEYSYGETLSSKQTISVNDVVMDKDSIYFAKGFKLTGHDKEGEDGKKQFITNISAFQVTQDVSYEVAYGVKAKMVTYKARYLDQSGSTLAAEDTYYGNIGDKPTVAYKFIDGYLPASYTLAKTLQDDPAENVIDFYYTKTDTKVTPVNPVAQGTTTNRTNNGTGNAAAGNGGNAAAGNGGNAAAGGNAANTANIGDNSTPLANAPAQYTDLDSNPTPTTAPGLAESSSKLPFIIGGIIALLIAVGGLLALSMRRRRAEAEAV